MKMIGRIRVRVLVTALVGLLLGASSPTPNAGVITVPLSGDVDFGNPHLYIALVVTDPRVEEVRNGYAMIKEKYVTGYVDDRYHAPEWSTERLSAISDEYDLGALQFLQVVRGIRGLGFDAASVHPWMVYATEKVLRQPTTAQVRLGEILIDIGTSKYASLTANRLVEGPLRMLEQQANVHVAPSAYGYPRINCGEVAQQTASILHSSAARMTSDLEKAVGRILTLTRVDVHRSAPTLCLDLHPITVYFANRLIKPRLDALIGAHISGMARYAIGKPIANPSGKMSSESFDEDKQYNGLQAFGEIGNTRYVGSAYALKTKLQPDVAMLEFLYSGYSRQMIDSIIRRGAAAGVPPSDTFVAFNPDEAKIWVRVTPTTNERAETIVGAFGVRGAQGPRLATIMRTCAGRNAAIAAALGRSREDASRVAGVLGAQVGQLLSMTLYHEIPENASCGVEESATVSQLVKLVGETEWFEFNRGPMVARFRIRVDAAWSMTGKPNVRIPADKTYSRRLAAPPCTAAQNGALQQDIKAAVHDYGGVWSFLIQPPFGQPEHDRKGCLQSGTITILKHP